MSTIISLDTETTGFDRFHGAKPFYVTIGRLGLPPLAACWPVDPLTRQPKVDPDDVKSIQQHIDEAETVVFHNAKFDIGMLSTIGVRVPWEKVEDTLIASHILGSNTPHNLTYLSQQYLNHLIDGFEKRLEQVVQECRRHCRSKLPDWAIASKGLEINGEQAMPSSKEKTWQCDMWLPGAIADYYEFSEDHEYRTVLANYAMTDADATLALWVGLSGRAGRIHDGFKAILERLDYWSIYKRRMRLPPIILGMEERGVTYSGDRLTELITSYEEKERETEETCLAIASHYDYALTLPKGSKNKSLEEFLFNVLKVPILNRTEKGNPAMDVDTLHGWEASLPPKSLEQLFIKNLLLSRRVQKTHSDARNYERFGVGIQKEKAHHPDNPAVWCNWHVLHPNINPTGSATLRFSFSNPNSANVSKEGIHGVQDHSMRYAFGPAPGREWWSADAQNIELRIPAFEAGETDLMWVFNNPDKPPYYGSYHYAIFDLLHPELFKRHGKECKKVFASTWYQWVKNGNFAVIYGCQEAKADLTYRVPGAFKKIRYRFPKIAALSERMMRQAERYGYVETIPDKFCNPRRGYPLQCTRSEYGRVMPTVPLNYHVQSTAMWWTCEAMIRCEEQLEKWRNPEPELGVIPNPFMGYIALQVHDEIVFDFPKSEHPPEQEYKRLQGNPKGFQRPDCNLWRIRVLQRLMEKGGEAIGVPTPTGVEYHPENWATGITLT